MMQMMRTRTATMVRTPCSVCCVRPSPRRATLSIVAATPAPAAASTGKPIEKLKRAPSPFNLFYKAKFAQVKADLQAKGKGGTLPECAKALREQWDSLPAGQKQPFEKQAAEVKVLFEKAKAEGRLVSVKPPKPLDPAGPKPISTYAAFTKAQFPAFKAKHPEKTVAEIGKLIGAAWKALDEGKKAALKAQYDKEMAAYHDRQAKLGITPGKKPAAAKPSTNSKPAAPAAPKAAAAPAPAAAAPKRASPTPAQQAPAPAKATTSSPARGATPVKRSTPSK